MKNECILEVHVIPNSKEFKITEFNSEKKALKIKINSVPEKGKANKELIKRLEKEFKCKIELIKGIKNKNKTIKLNKSFEEIKQKIKL
jgi:uncharacterized protein